MIVGYFVRMYSAPSGNERPQGHIRQYNVDLILQSHWGLLLLHTGSAQGYVSVINLPIPAIGTSMQYTLSRKDNVHLLLKDPAAR